MSAPFPTNTEREYWNALCACHPHSQLEIYCMEEHEMDAQRSKYIQAARHAVENAMFYEKQMQALGASKNDEETDYRNAFIAEACQLYAKAHQLRIIWNAMQP